jgi:hypothetical protein
MTLPIVAFLLTVVTWILPARAGAATIVVPPGTGTLQAAVDAAAPGDTLFLNGLYVGAVTVAKSHLTMRVPVRATAVIDAGCTSATALTISGSHVALVGHRGEFIVEGATDTDVSVSGSTGVNLNPVTAQAVCGSENYGFDIATSTRLRFKVAALPSMGPFAKAAFRLRDVTGPVTVAKNFRTLDSLVIEDSGTDTTKAGKSGIRIELGYAPAPLALSLSNAHAILIRLSALGAVQIDSQSSNNAFVKCSEFSTFTDLGSGTCGQDNSGFTLPPCS